MAFGDPKGTQLVLSGNSVGATNVLATGSADVVVGDLVLVCFAQQTALTASGVIDDLGNTYTAANAGSDGGTITGRFFYSRVTVAGTITAITVSATGSTNDFAGVARAIEGPFDAADLLGSTTPANTTADITTPFVCPASGTLDVNGGRSKLVVGWTTRDNNVAWAADSPNIEVAETNRVNVGVTIGVQVVTGTTSTSPAFSGTNPGAIVLGTIAFNMGVQAYVGEEKLAGSGSLSSIAKSASRAAETLAGAGSFSAHATVVEAEGGAEDFPTWEYSVYVPYRRILAYDSYFQVPLKPSVAHVGEARFSGAGNLSANTVSAAVEDIPTWTHDTLVPYRRVLAYQSYFEAPFFVSATAHSGEAIFNGAGSLSARLTQGMRAAATFQGTGSLSALLSQGMAAQAIFAGSGSLTVEATTAGRQAGEATFQGAGSFSAHVTVREAGYAAFQGAGSLSANALLAGQVQARFAGAGSLSVDAAKVKPLVQATFQGAGNLSVYVSQQHRRASRLFWCWLALASVRQAYAGYATFAGCRQLLGLDNAGPCRSGNI